MANTWPNALQVRPIERWPTVRTPSDARKSGRFRTSLSDTLVVLDRELHNLSARDIWMEIAVAPGDHNWRLDGRPRANAPVDHPGVVLVFFSGSVRKELRYATDRHTTWQENLRAIALGLEALRKIERYGIAERGQQYAGWTALPSGLEAADPERGRELVSELGGMSKALRATHPDTRGNGYSDQDFNDVLSFKQRSGT